VRLPLDDDVVASRLAVNRHYVNQVCRQLAREGSTLRWEGQDGKLVNQWVSDRENSDPITLLGKVSSPRRRVKRSERARSNVEELVGRFADFVRRFERSNAFPGPSVYFHERAIERRREHRSAGELLLARGSSSTCTPCYRFGECTAWGSRPPR
jgi:hypothetical protein